MNSALSHSAPQLQVDPISNTVRMPCCKGYCTSKASHGVESGTWYFEVEILQGTAVRVGWGQALAELQAPIGYDEYGYGISSKHRKIFHCSRGYPVDFNDPENSADKLVIGCLLSIPDNLELLEEGSVDRFLIAEIVKKYPPLNFLTTYNVKQNLLKSGTIKFYANGQEIKEARFDNIYRAKYFPCVSVYGDSVAKVIFRESEFKYAIPEGAAAFENVKDYKEPTVNGK